MRLGENELPAVLADAWERWASRCGELTLEQWHRPTRCQGWDVRALVAHLCPNDAMFDTLEAAIVDEPPVVRDAAELLRRFNEPGGVAHTSADQLADQAVSDSAALTAVDAVVRFNSSAARVRGMALSAGTVIRYPAVGSTTMAVVGEVALMEATVHLLDLADAVGGVEPSPQALAATRDLLIAVPDPTAAVEVLAGRRPAQGVLPAIR